MNGYKRAWTVADRIARDLGMKKGDTYYKFLVRLRNNNDLIKAKIMEMVCDITDSCYHQKDMTGNGLGKAVLDLLHEYNQLQLT